MWTWIMAAPARSHASAVATSSASVTGRAGTSLLAVSAPVGATVIRVRAELMRAWCHVRGRGARCADKWCLNTPALPADATSDPGPWREPTFRVRRVAPVKAFGRRLQVPRSNLLTGTVETVLHDLGA